MRRWGWGPSEAPRKPAHRWESGLEVVATAVVMTAALALALVILPLWALVGAAVTGLVLWRAT